MKITIHIVFLNVILFFAYCALTISYCFSQGVWTQKASFPGSPRGDAFSFSIGNNGYLALGSNSNSWFNDVWKYDALGNSWTQKQNFGGTRWQGVFFTIGTKGYMGTGQDASSTLYNDLWEYDPLSDSWTQKANLPTAGRFFAAGFAVGGKGYIGTGLHGTSVYYHDLWEYDTLANSWTQKANFPPGGRLAAVGLSIGTEGYIGMGKDTLGDCVGDFWEYDPSSDSWTQKINYPGGTREEIDGAHFIIGNYGYMGTGFTYIGSSWFYYNDFWRYNPANDTWLQIPNLPATVRAGASNFSINNKGYIGLGFIVSTVTALNDLWEYDTTSVGVNEINLENSISVFPNPSTGKFTVQSQSVKITSLEIYNVLGEMVYSKQATRTQENEIDISSEPEGVYFVRARTSEGVVSKKILVVK